MSPSALGDETVRVLFVCTANQCRSPMAAAMAADLLERRAVDAVVASCGVMEGGVPASHGAVKAMAKRGLDLGEHRSHQMDSDTVAAADLIITMERLHISSVAELSVPAVRRTFTLMELADLTAVVGPRRRDQSVQRWIAQADAMRMPEAVITANSDSDIDDPMGGPARAYRRTADQIHSLLGVVVDALFPAV